MSDNVVCAFILAFPFLVFMSGLFLIGTGEYDATGELVGVHPGLLLKLMERFAKR